MEKQTDMIIHRDHIDKSDGYEIPKIKYVIENIYDHILDWYYHIETAKKVRLGIHDNIKNYMYEPFPYAAVFTLFEKYPFTENDGFIDIGCGKGRVLIGAVLRGCCNIYGIDISEELLICANNNMLEFQKKNAGLSYQLLCMDAKDYFFSPDINKVFLYNPFNLKILIKVLKRLVCSIEAYPREVMLFVGGSEGILKYVDSVKDFRLIAIEKNVHVYQYISRIEASTQRIN